MEDLNSLIQSRIAAQLGEALCKIIIRDVHIAALEEEIKELKAKQEQEHGK